MSDCCDLVFLREPVIGDYEAMGNELLTFAFELWNNQAETDPFDFTGYVGRCALRNPEPPNTATPATSVTISGNLVVAKFAKATIETLAVATPFVFDLSVDRASDDDSFCLWTGTITFRQGATS